MKDNEKVDHVLDYLAVVGARPEGEKWRWLGHGVFVARHIQKDNKRALELARILASNPSPHIGMWAKQMPALILQSEGNSDEAYKIMLNLLKDSADKVHPNEVNYMLDYMCNTILEDRELAQKPDFCANIL